MVRLFGQHELGGACQGIETGLGQRAQLELAIAIREIRKHVERQPVGGFLVERAQYAGAVLVARIKLQPGIGLDRKSVEKGKRVSIRLVLEGRRLSTTKKKK